MSEALPPDPSRRYIVCWWTPETNEIDLDPDPRLSCFDIAGVLSHAIDIAVNWLPLHDHEEVEPDEDMEEDA